ncbi:1,2-phenylacetyl-CoA epoxidase subunit PaaC [Cupriavidus oxalaticus]|uniref:Multicomponent oxygenase/reductase subunit for phenylacetic acid degradation n=1 Tax=Cupriavidus oxalaticus TaxID=96344 RepID=A0A976GDJ1_9BURK|nr:1,2-phenylacetyl-CoA epoxidase subunit PaaC [Cupriavidus oxalaticus]QRQ85091.1 phenylacetate-CoA oxygenase subunit PaaC [Cupriavidus oxalaticus]QRQ90821.1 phenylacetate-CoA oxygenase subunit PaaC [Cupriavidus oxalaticus]WQD85349.1 1,2-phenylacetyl-CoA epoxidase subunit PaaC [Cupriavidus oxalaticus]SPC23275.1 putative multicomponent oxygenase/reductase subunit for phenylacetic acid degradation [Cupriavidus oxalaticus]
MTNHKLEYLLRLGDSTLVLGQRLSEWCGRGPALEEDIALTNVALDLVGQTRLWLGYAAEVEGAGRSADQLAFLRDAHQFRNLLLVEQPNGSYADTLARQFLFDTWHYFQLEALQRSTDARIAEIAAKSLKEVTYHVRRSADLVVRLGDGNEESHRRMQDAFDDLWMFTGELFEADAAEAALANEGVIPDPATLAEPWQRHVGEVLEEATLRVPASQWAQSGGRHGRHTEHLGYLLAEMQFLQRAYPGAQW